MHCMRVFGNGSVPGNCQCRSLQMLQLIINRRSPLTGPPCRHNGVSGPCSTQHRGATMNRPQRQQESAADAGRRPAAGFSAHLPDLGWRRAGFGASAATGSCSGCCSGSSSMLPIEARRDFCLLGGSVSAAADSIDAGAEGGGGCAAIDWGAACRQTPPCFLPQVAHFFRLDRGLTVRAVATGGADGWLVGDAIASMAEASH